MFIVLHASGVLNLPIPTAQNVELASFLSTNVETQLIDQKWFINRMKKEKIIKGIKTIGRK